MDSQKKLVNSKFFIILVGLIAFTCCLCLHPKEAYAFNKQGAILYADTYVFKANPSYRKFSSNCTNYVSQIMYNGGGLTQNYNWYYNGYTNYSATWTVADSLKNHIRDHGIGTKIGSWSKTEIFDYVTFDYVTYAYINNSSNLFGGNEVIFYDWDGNGVMNHAGFCVRTGTDPSSNTYGDLINQNTSDRKNAIWHLDPYNSDRKTTRIYAFRLY